MNNTTNTISLDFLISSLSDGEIIKTEDVIKWIKEKNDEVKSNIQQVPLTELNNWIYDDTSIRNQNGRFFSIKGIRIQTNQGVTTQWNQPIIDQPEIGILGIITKKINGILHFLTQAKIEPGNINIVQLSPTLQATKSNYTCAHKGKVPLFLDYFIGNKNNVSILIDSLQSEQGARFFKKRNRNIIIQVPENEELSIPDNFIWLSLGQIKRLLQHSNIVNMDTRSVISCINFGAFSNNNLDLFNALSKFVSHKFRESNIYPLLGSDGKLHNMREILNWFADLKFKAEMSVTEMPLSDVKNWEYDGMELSHVSKKYFSVIGVRVAIDNREVQTWDQPMVKPSQEGLIAFIVKKINGIYHFLVQAKMEIGNFDTLELAPTVQCLTGNYREGENEYTVPYIKDVLCANDSCKWFSVYQSEEGGRFYKEQNLNVIVEVDDSFDENVYSNYCWMTYNQLSSFVMYNNYLNIAARSLLSAINIYC